MAYPPKRRMRAVRPSTASASIETPLLMSSVARGRGGVGRRTIRSRNIADVTRETELDVAAVGGAGGADPLRGAGLVDAEALGEDRCGEPAGEGEQRAVTAGRLVMP